MKALKLALAASVATNVLLLWMVFKHEPAQHGGHALGSFFLPQPLDAVTDDPLKVEYGIPVDYNDEGKEDFNLHFQSPPSAPKRLGVPDSSTVEG